MQLDFFQEFDKEDDRDIKLISVDSGETETSDEGRIGAPPSPSVIQPQPAPRKISSTSQPVSRTYVWIIVCAENLWNFSTNRVCNVKESDEI